MIEDTKLLVKEVPWNCSYQTVFNCLIICVLLPAKPMCISIRKATLLDNKGSLAKARGLSVILPSHSDQRGEITKEILPNAAAGDSTKEQQ